jgi:hypothetical protein
VGVGIEVGVGVGSDMGVGVGSGVAIGDGLAVGVGVGVGVGVSDCLASVPHRRTEPIATLRLPRSSARTRVATSRLNVRPRITDPFAFDVTVGNTMTRAPSLEQLPEYSATQ